MHRLFSGSEQFSRGESNDSYILNKGTLWVLVQVVPRFLGQLKEDFDNWTVNAFCFVETLAFQRPDRLHESRT